MNQPILPIERGAAGGDQSIKLMEGGVNKIKKGGGWQVAGGKWFCKDDLPLATCN